MSSPSQDDLNTLLEYYLSGVCILIVSVVGLSGNIVSGLVFKCRHRDTNQTFTNLLVWLAVIDSGFLVLVLLLFSLPHLSAHYSDWIFPYIVPTVLPCTSVAMTASLYTVIALCVERYLTVTGHRQSNMGAFMGYILPVSIFSTFYNMPKFFEFSTQFMLTDEGYIPYIQPTEFRQNPDYSSYVLGLNLIFMGFLPFTVLIFFNILISRRLKTHATQVERPDSPLSVLLYSIVALQMVCHVPRTALNIYEIYQSFNTNILFPFPWLVDISHLLLVISSSANVIIFTVQDQLFRSSVLKDLKTVLSLYRHDNSNRDTPRDCPDRSVTNMLLKDNSEGGVSAA